VWTDITGRKNLEEEITMREQQLSSFFTGAAAGLANIDPSFRYVRVNETLAKINGFSPEAHRGRTVGELVPALAPVLLPHLQRVLRTGEPIKGVEVSGEVPSEPGVTRFWTGSYFPVTGLCREIEGIGAVIVEITDRKRAEAALFESEQKFRQLAENIEDVFWITAADLSQMIYVSPAYEKIWGRPIADLYRNPHEWSEAIVPEDRARVIELFSRILEGTSVTGVEYRIRRPDDTLIWISDRGFPIRNAEGKIYRQAGVATNITEKKRLEAQFLRAQRMESIGTLAGGIAHDLNNVLAPILVSLDLLGDEQSASDRQEVLDILQTSAQRGAEMVKHLLTFARGIEGQKVPLQLKHLLRELQRILKQTLPKSIQIRMTFSGDLWAVLGDATQLHQVVLNLCVNARDAMPHGGNLTIKASNFTVDENFAAMSHEAVPGPYVTLSVADTGTGIPPEIRDRIFDPFFTTKGLDKGTGLGLATVQGIVRSHGGFISCYTEVDHGTEFRVYLPATVGESAAKAELDHSEPPVGNGERILVIDDEDALRVLSRKTLEAYGYEVLLAVDGAQGVAFCAREGQKIHLVITDLAMPVMDGAATIRAIRSLYPEMKIIAWSGLDAEGKSAQPEPFGANAFLHKPFTAEKLLTTVRDILDRSPL
jgi:PAS domain S-box-containing protein